MACTEQESAPEMCAARCAGAQLHRNTRGAGGHPLAAAGGCGGPEAGHDRDHPARCERTTRTRSTQACEHVSTHTHTHTHTQARTHMHTRARMHTQTLKHSLAHAHTYTRAHTLAHTLMCLPSCMHMHAHERWACAQWGMWQTPTLWLSRWMCKWKPSGRQGY